MTNEEHNKYQKKWRLKHKHKGYNNEYAKKWYEKNRDEQNIKNREYGRKYREKNREKLNKYAREKRKYYTALLTDFDGFKKVIKIPNKKLTINIFLYKKGNSLIKTDSYIGDNSLVTFQLAEEFTGNVLLYLIAK